MNIRVFCSIFLSCVLTCLCSGQARSKAYVGPNALGPYELGKRTLMSTMLDRLKVSPIKQVNPVCFRSTDGTYMWIERMGVDTSEERALVGSLLLSVFPNCIGSPVHDTSEAVGKWQTKEGLGLGCTKQDVLRTYGKPSEDNLIKGDLYRGIIVGDFRNGHYTIKPKPNIGEEVLEYSATDTLLSADFGLHNGVVIWIVISENP